MKCGGQRLLCVLGEGDWGIRLLLEPGWLNESGRPTRPDWWVWLAHQIYSANLIHEGGPLYWNYLSFIEVMYVESIAQVRLAFRCMKPMNFKPSSHVLGCSIGSHGKNITRWNEMHWTEMRWATLALRSERVVLRNSLAIWMNLVDQPDPIDGYGWPTRFIQPT